MSFLAAILVPAQYETDTSGSWQQNSRWGLLDYAAGG